MKRSTVQSFLQEHFTQYQQSHLMPLYQLKAVTRLMSCRTEALGGHAIYCEEGHLNGVWYNSCKHRSCPQCGAINSAQWLKKSESLVLECKHHHWIFTLPHELHCIWLFNRAFCQTLLMQSVRKTIQKLSADDKYLAAVPGFISALHTWARNLIFHPHVHCLISHGGINKQGKWQWPKRKCFIPAKVLMAIFRGKFLAGVQAALNKGELVIPSRMNEQQVKSLCNKWGRKEWVIHCVKPYEHGRGVVKYLAKYIRGGSIKNRQIIAITKEHVRYCYKSHQTKKTEFINLKHDDFMDRLLSHIAQPKKQQYQMLGIYHNKCREKLNLARAEFLQKEIDKVDKIGWQEFLENHDIKQNCKECGKPLSVLKPLNELEDMTQLNLISTY
jgi:hypothetical protein